MFCMAPCKTNIMYATSTFKSVVETLTPMLDRLQKERLAYPRTIIYCRRFQDCSDIYIYLKEKLRRESTEPEGAPDLPKFRLFDMFVSCTDVKVKDDK